MAAAAKASKEKTSNAKPSGAHQRVAAVTGGASGIGAATAERLAADGYAVAILDRSTAQGGAHAKAIGGGARFYECDVADPASNVAVAARIAKEMGPVEVLVTAAGLIPNMESVLTMDMAAHDRMWAVNYHGTLHTARAFAHQMIAAKRGAIVTIGSINSLMPMALPAYNPAKAAVVRLTQLLAAELGRHNIRVNSVGPTYVMTPPLQAAVASGRRDMKKIMAAHTLGYLPEPKDIAAAIAFLASDQARAITGVLLPVDCGWTTGVSYNSYAGGVPWET